MHLAVLPFWRVGIGVPQCCQVKKKKRVIPAKAGISGLYGSKGLMGDSRLRGNDRLF